MTSPHSRLELLRDMHQQDPKDGFVAYGLAMELAKNSASRDEAVAMFRHILREIPEYLPAYLQFGSLLGRCGEVTEARQVYELGIALAQKQGDHHTREELKSAMGML